MTTSLSQSEIENEKMYGRLTSVLWENDWLFISTNRFMQMKGGVTIVTQRQNIAMLYKYILLFMLFNTDKWHTMLVSKRNKKHEINFLLTPFPLTSFFLLILHLILQSQILIYNFSLEYEVFALHWSSARTFSTITWCKIKSCTSIY